MSVPNVLAKALYDNVAESPDELSFRKGDIMTVLERDTQGLDGWWLCSLHGRQGIVPGNRLKILVGMYDSKQQGTPSTPEPATSSSQVQRPLPPLSAYAKPSRAPSSAAVATSSSGYPIKPSTQYTPMHPAYSTPSPAQTNPDSIYMMPPSHGPKPSPQSLYQIPSGPSGLPPGPPSKGPALAQRQYQLAGQDIYQVPPSMGSGPGQGVAPAGGTGAGQDVYQVPPSLEKRNWESSNKPLGKVVVPTRVGQVYVYDTVKADQDEYDVPPRHQPPTHQDIYDVPPTRQQYNTQVYDTPPMVMKGPSSGQDIYDTPASTDKSTQQTVYDFPPSVSKDVPDAQPIREETYDVPPHFAKLKPVPVPPGQYLHNNLNDDDEPPIPEDVYDVPPPILTDKRYRGDRSGVSQAPQDIYDIPASLRTGGHTAQDVYDFPREREEKRGERGDHYIYDVPPQVVRDAQSTSEELTLSFKRLSASSTGSTRSNHSASSLDMVPVRDTSSSSSLPASGPIPGKPLILDLEQAMERLSRFQQAVESSVSLMMSFITGNWRSPAHLEGNLPAIHQAADRVRSSVRDFLEFARGAVANSAQATDRSLQTKLGRQVGKMEEVFQSLIRHSQGLDTVSWSHTALSAPPPGGDDLDRLIMTARGIPDDAKQLASFLHGNASLLFKRTNRQQQQLPLPPIPGDSSGHMTGSGSGSYQGGEKVHIQSRPLPSPPKFTAAEEEEGVDRPYETTEEGWMEDYDYVHLQGKEEFEKNQKQLLEKGNIIRHKTQLEQQQIKQFERLEQEVSRPINNDMTGWVPSPHHPLPNQQAQNGSGGPPPCAKLCNGDRQLLLFYQEQCEQNVTTVTNAIDAFFTAVNSNQPPKIFVAHSKFVILSAHKLVFIGDTLSRQAKSPDVRARVAQSSNTLCEKLKDIVISTKTAALQYPSPGAAREMTERVRELAGCTQQFSNLPLVGLWLSGVTHVYNPQVWVWCLRFLYSSALRDRVLSESSCFLLVLFGSTHRAPQFFQCRGPGPRPGPEPQLDYQLLTSSQCVTLYQQVVSVEGRSLRCELGSEDHSRQMKVFREAQTSFSRAAPPAAGLSVSDQDSGVEDEDLSPRPSPSPHPPAQQARRVRPSVPELSLLIDSSFSSNQNARQDPGSAHRPPPPAAADGKSAPPPPAPPHLHSTPNSNLQQPCSCCSSHTYNCTSIFSSPGLHPAAPPSSHHLTPPPRSSLHPAPPSPSSHHLTPPPPSSLHPAPPSPSSHHLTPPSSSLHPAHPPPPPPSSHHLTPPPSSSNHPTSPSAPPSSIRPLSSHPHTPPPPAPWCGDSSSPPPLFSRPSCVSRCCDQVGGVVPSDTYQLLLHQERQLRLLQEQVQMLLEAQGTLQSSGRQVDTQTPRSTASIAVGTGASLFWGDPVPSPLPHQEVRAPPPSSSSSSSHNDLSVIGPVGGAEDSDITGQEADQHRVGGLQSPVLGESVSMYGPADEQHSFYHNLMSQLTSRLQEEEESRRSSLSVLSSSSHSSQSRRRRSCGGDPVVGATVRRLQQLGVDVDQEDLTESERRIHQTVESSSTLASINPAAVLSRLSVSDPTASSLFHGGSVDLSLEANAIALRYLSDATLSRLSLGGPAPRPGSASSSNDSLLSPSNMSLATRKYMRRYGLIEEEEVREAAARQPLTEALNVKLLPQSQLIRDLRPKMQLLAGGAEPNAADKENCSGRRPSLARASGPQTEGSVGNILDLSRLRQLSKLF